MTTTDPPTSSESKTNDETDEATEEEDQFEVGPFPRSESSFVLKTRIDSDPSSSHDTDQELPFPIFLRRANTVSSSEFRKRHKLRFFNRRKKQSPQLVMADSSSQLALFHHLRGNTSIKQVCEFDGVRHASHKLTFYCLSNGTIYSPKKQKPSNRIESSF